MHVAGKGNTDDLASIGCLPSNLASSLLFLGTSFLHKLDAFNHSPVSYRFLKNDENVRTNVTTSAVTSSFTFSAERLSQFSSFSRLIRAVALCLKWVESFRSKTCTACDVLPVPDLDDAKSRVIRLVQVSLYLL